MAHRTGVRATLKTVVLVAVFAVASAGMFLISIAYGIVATVVLSLLYAIPIGVIAKVVGNEQPIPFDLLALIALALDLAFVVLLVLVASFIFITCPMRVGGVIDSLSTRWRSWEVDRVNAAARRMAESIGVQPFTHLIPNQLRFVGAIQVGQRRALCIDFAVLEVLEDRELEAVLAHEYGHFSRGLSTSYGFLRRCSLASQFLDAEIVSGGDETLFRKLVRVGTFALPDLLGMKSNFRMLFVHVAAIMTKSHSFVTNCAVRLFRREFHEAELAADELAARIVSPRELVSALVKVSAMQVRDSSCRSSPNPSLDDLCGAWKAAATRRTSMHPSLISRVCRCAGDSMHVDAEELSRLAGTILARKHNPISAPVQASLGPALIQSLCGESLGVG